MGLQPAAGAKDLNPKQLVLNQLLCKKLSDTYKLWGYQEICPPRVERLDTLIAGGGIANNEIVRLVADEPLGLRPEMTASIARAACTRLSNKPRPLRLWAEGTVFQSKIPPEGGLYIEENLHSGVEMFGIDSITAEMELLSLLIDSFGSLNLKIDQNPILLIGHNNLISLILNKFKQQSHAAIKQTLANFDRLFIAQMELNSEDKRLLNQLLQLRGSPEYVLSILENEFGETQVTSELKSLFSIIQPIAERQGIRLQLDPTFQSQLNIYTGIIIQLVCKGISAPIVIAKGGRYDKLVENCGAKGKDATGLGFSFAIDHLRELSSSPMQNGDSNKNILITFNNIDKLHAAMNLQREYHRKGVIAVADHEPCSNKIQAQKRMQEKGFSDLEWLDK